MRWEPERVAREDRRSAPSGNPQACRPPNILKMPSGFASSMASPKTPSGLSSSTPDSENAFASKRSRMPDVFTSIFSRNAKSIALAVKASLVAPGSNGATGLRGERTTSAVESPFFCRSHLKSRENQWQALRSASELTKVRSNGTDTSWCDTAPLGFSGTAIPQYALDEWEEWDECDEWEEWESCCAIITVRPFCWERTSLGATWVEVALFVSATVGAPDADGADVVGMAFAPAATATVPPRTASFPAMPLSNDFLSSGMRVSLSLI